MYWLSHSYLLQGRLDEAESSARESLEGSRRAYGENQENTNERRYLLARVLARQARREEAIAVLEEALDSGFRQPDMAILDDSDFASLHGDPEFEVIVEELKRRNEEGATGEPAAGAK